MISAEGGSTPSSRSIRHSISRSEIAIPPRKNSHTKPAIAATTASDASANAPPVNHRSHRGQLRHFARSPIMQKPPNQSRSIDLPLSSIPQADGSRVESDP